MEWLRQLLASATGRRFTTVLAGVLLLVQLAAVGHLHLVAPDSDRHRPHAVCDLCVAADRSAVAPPSISIHLPFLAAAAPTRAVLPAPPASPAPGGYSSRAPPLPVV